MGKVIDFRAYKARELAIAKAERIRELAEWFACYPTTTNANEAARECVQMGWCSDDEARLALEAVAEREVAT
jgi:hypothetical protein